MEHSTAAEVVSQGHTGMPIFQISSHKLVPVEQTNFLTEKQLQTLVEANLGPVFNCRFVASEFSTGSQHAGRIDTLALSEDCNPVIIEYKKVESSELINQSLFYLSWIYDHKGDFHIAVQKSLGNEVKVDWTDVRVICLAPNYKKYDLHAVQVMGANIELWRYRLFKNSCLFLEEVFQKTVSTFHDIPATDKSPVMIAAGKKAALTRATGIYSFEQHISGKSETIKEMVFDLRDFIMNLDSAMEEVPKKFYVAYKISQNIVCIEVKKHKVILYLKLNPKDISDLPSIARDVSEIGHYGTGDLEITLTSAQDLEAAKEFINAAYQKVGG
jgi:predicted transport protein